MKKAFTILCTVVAVSFAANVNAQTCVADQFGGAPNCTANDQADFTLEVVNVDAACNGSTAQLDLNIIFGQGNATTRYDIGGFVATDGGDAETGGSCQRSFATAGSVGASDADGDACYDKISSQGVVLEFNDIVVDCSGGAVVSACVTWGQQVNAVDTDDDDLCSDADDLIPGTTAKCVCGTTPFTDIPGILPVELVAFGGQVDGSDVSLNWETALEINNAGFSVEHSFRGSEFAEVGFVDGAGTSDVSNVYSLRVPDLAAGKHKFRLKQIDFDGAFEYSNEIELSVGVPDRYVLESAYPNPFNPNATINFLVAESAPVSVEMYNILGVHVRTLYDGTPDANTTQTLSIDGSDLPSGLYVVRITGTNFTGSQQVTLLK